jgi:hypothetical protein
MFVKFRQENDLTQITPIVHTPEHHPAIQHSSSSRIETSPPMSEVFASFIFNTSVVILFLIAASLKVSSWRLSLDKGLAGL